MKERDGSNYLLSILRSRHPTWQSSALFMYLSRQLSRSQDVIKDFKKGFLPMIIPVGIICVLIAPSNLSTALLRRCNKPAAYVYRQCEPETYRTYDRCGPLSRS